MKEFEKAVEEFLALPLAEQNRILKECSERAERISDEFDRKTRLEPWMWNIQITI